MTFQECNPGYRIAADTVYSLRKHILQILNALVQVLFAGQRAVILQQRYDCLSLAIADARVREDRRLHSLAVLLTLMDNGRLQSIRTAFPHIYQPHLAVTAHLIDKLDGCTSQAPGTAVQVAFQ